MLKQKLFTACLLLMALTAKADFCQIPSRQTQAQLLEKITQVSTQALELRNRLETSTLSHADAPQKLSALKTEISKLRQSLQSQARSLTASEGKMAVALYFAALDNAAAADLLLNSSASRLYSDAYYLQLPLDKYADFATDVDELPGINTYLGKSALLTLNPTSKYFAELSATARPLTAVNKNTTYFRTLKCVLNRMNVEKKIGIATILGEAVRFPVDSTLAACHRLSFSHLLPNPRTLHYESRKYSAQKVFKSTLDVLTQDELQQIDEAAKVTGLTLNDLFILSSDAATAEFSANQSADSRAYLQAINSFRQIIEKAEDKISREAPFMAELADDLSTAGTSAISKAIACRYELTNDDHQLIKAVLNRVLMAQLSTFISKNGLIAFSKPENFTETLNEVLVKSTERLTEVSAFLLVAWGYVSIDEKIHFNDEISKQLLSGLRTVLSQSTTIKNKLAAISTESHASFTGSLLQRNPEIQRRAEKIHSIMNPATSRGELKFEKAAIGKLFAGNIDGLAAPFKYYAEQILTRKDWASQKSAWQRYNQSITNDVRANKYTCAKTGLGTKVKDFFGGIVQEMTLQERSPPQSRIQSESCEFLKRLASHLGLNRSTEPKTLQDVWSTFTSNYDGTDQKNFEKNYRSFLKTLEIYAYPVLDIEMNSLGLPEKLPDNYYLYDYLTKSNNTKAKNTILAIALRKISQNIDSSITQVAQAQKLSDLNVFIQNSNAVNSVLGAKQINAYIPNVFGEDNTQLAQTVFSGVFDTHTQYQNNLIRTNRFAYRIYEESMSRIMVPMFWLGGASLARFTAIGLTGRRAVGGALYAAGGSMSPIIQGYFGSINLLFAGGIANAYAWEKNINNETELIEKLKLSDYIVIEGGEPPLLSYEDYITQKNALSAEHSDVKFKKYLYIGLTALVAIAPSLEAYASYSAAKKAALPASRTASSAQVAADISKRTSRYQRFKVSRVGMMLEYDLRTLKSPLRWLGSPKDLSLNALRSAKNSSSHRLADDAYKRVIFKLGQRLSRYLGNPEYERKAAEKLFGNASRTRELGQIVDEYNKLFPDFTMNGVR